MANLIRNWYEKFADTSCLLCMGKSLGQVWARKQVCSAGLST